MFKLDFKSLREFIERRAVKFVEQKNHVQVRFQVTEGVHREGSNYVCGAWSSFRLDPELFREFIERRVVRFVEHGESFMWYRESRRVMRKN